MALDESTVAELRALRVSQAECRLLVGAGYVDHDLVFARPDGWPVYPDRFARTSVEQAARLGLPPMRLHDLRHKVGDIGAAETSPRDPQLIGDELAPRAGKDLNRGIGALVAEGIRDEVQRAIDVLRVIGNTTHCILARST